ncbi:MAG: hypothetical protein K1X94_17770, partial [Sandaracinaceae bacterium]|nr:hypothetical protein [Sandaracinaceae bacterium]
FVEALRNQRVLAAALSAITAAVVGVILNLSIWFALHVLFREVGESHVGPLRVLLPTLASLEWPALVIGVVGGLCLLVAKLGVPRTLAIGAALGVVAKLAVTGP